MREKLKERVFLNPKKLQLPLKLDCTMYTNTDATTLPLLLLLLFLQCCWS
jgi:hypothetical protein